MKKNLLILFALFLLSACFSKNQDPEARAYDLGKRVRCPMCRGVSIADSPSEISREMMGLIRQQVAEGKTDEEVLQYFETRYGEWALLEPKAEGINLAIWIIPAVFLAGGVVFIVKRIKT